MISKEIRYMLAIRRYGSITKAADSLFITQSGLSKAVKNIERQLAPLCSAVLAMT
ncbi:MAG: LysR family transcriptional regulator [Enterocloster sp.]